MLEESNFLNICPLWFMFLEISSKRHDCVKVRKNYIGADGFLSRVSAWDTMHGHLSTPAKTFLLHVSG